MPNSIVQKKEIPKWSKWGGEDFTISQMINWFGNKCPFCGGHSLRYGNINFTYGLWCSLCNMALIKKFWSDKFTLIEGESTFRGQTKSVKEWKTIWHDRAGKAIKELSNRIKRNGLPDLLEQGIEVNIFLKKREIAHVQEDDVILFEKRRKTVRSGGGTFFGIRIPPDIKEVSEWKQLDKGVLVLTNKRLVFVGSDKMMDIDLKKILSINLDDYRLIMHRQGKQRVEGFGVRNPETWKIAILSTISR